MIIQNFKKTKGNSSSRQKRTFLTFEKKNLKIDNETLSGAKKRAGILDFPQAWKPSKIKIALQSSYRISRQTINYVVRYHIRNNNLCVPAKEKAFNYTLTWTRLSLLFSNPFLMNAIDK